MKDKRIWVVIVCILVIGTGVTHYTENYVKNQSAVAIDTLASTGDTTPPAPDSASGPEDGTQDGEPASALGRSRGAAPPPSGGTDHGSQPSLSGAAGNGSQPAPLGGPGKGGQPLPPGEAGNGGQSTLPEQAGNGNQPAPRGGAGNGNQPSPRSGAGNGNQPSPRSGAGNGSQLSAAQGGRGASGPDSSNVPETAGKEDSGQVYVAPDANEKSVPISPLTGAKSGSGNPGSTIDYRQRLTDLDAQIQRMREQDTDSNVYSLKTSAETELKMWESEMNTIYNALLNVVPGEDAKKLAADQKEWLKNRDGNAADNSGRNSGSSVDSIGYTATLASLTRERAYDLAGWYEEATGGTAPTQESAAPAGQEGPSAPPGR